MFYEIETGTAKPIKILNPVRNHFVSKFIDWYQVMPVQKWSFPNIFDSNTYYLLQFYWFQVESIQKKKKFNILQLKLHRQ